MSITISCQHRACNNACPIYNWTKMLFASPFFLILSYLYKTHNIQCDSNIEFIFVIVRLSYNRDSSLGSCIFKPTKRCFLDRYINPIFNIFTQHFILWLRNKLSCTQFPNIDTRLSLENVKTYSSAFFLAYTQCHHTCKPY